MIVRATKAVIVSRLIVTIFLHLRIDQLVVTIMASGPAPRKGGGMSLYANLLNGSAESTPGTISRAPVVFKQSSETDTQPDERKPQLDPGMFILEY